ncbi:MAG: MFS transporter [Actinobacteria bacterium]|nr:MFS transporter [Actinomycetota bacterium]
MARPAALTPLTDRRFAWFFTGRMISTSGSVMAPIAVSFAVLDVWGTPTAVGQVLAARSIPLVLFLLVGGVVADRLPRTTVLVVSHLASFATQGAAALLVISGRATLTQLIVLEALNGVMTAFTMPAIQGLVPQVVDRRYLQQANALLAFGRSGLAVLGPALAGLIVVTAGPGWALAIDALTWLLAGICMMFVRVPRLVATEHYSMLASLSSGWAVFRSYQWLWSIVLACGILNAIHAGAWMTMGPAMAVQESGIGQTGWGFAVSAEAVGLLLFTVVMMRARVGHPLRMGMIAMLGLALPLFALGAGAPLALLLVTAFVAGAGIQVFMISWHTAIHENIPERYQSRVAAYDALGSFVAMPVGQLAIGPVAAVAGERSTLIGSGLLFVTVVLAALAVPAVRGLRRGDPPSGSPPADSPPADALAAGSRVEASEHPLPDRAPDRRSEAGRPGHPMVHRFSSAGRRGEDRRNH